jgi:hypothetical protein
MSLHYDEKGKFFTDYVSKDTVKAIIQTTGNRIEGILYTRADERISDMLNRTEKFIAVTDASIYDLEGNALYTSEFLALNVDMVVWLIPEDEPSPETSEEERP